MVVDTPAKARSSASVLVELEDDPPAWLMVMFGPTKGELDEHGTAKPGSKALVRSGFSGHHLEFWGYVRRIKLGATVSIKGRVRDAFIAIWPRGHAKTTSMEMAVAYLIAKRARSFIVIISSSQSQANERVDNIGSLLQSRPFRDLYPSAATRFISDVGKKGSWNARQIQTSNRVTVRAFGLDAAMRGAKIEDARPDLIVLDDIDEESDSAYVTGEKQRRITRAVLPMGTDDLVVFGAQNLVLRDGIFDRLRGSADWLVNRIVSGPFPALRGFKWEAYEENGRPRYRIIEGTPTWSGQDLAACQVELDQIGIESFRIELQHETEAQGTHVFPQFSEERHAWPKMRIDSDTSTIQVLDNNGLEVTRGRLDNNGRYGYLLPTFDVIVGGVDYATEGESAHPSALMVGGYVQKLDLIVWLRAWKKGGAGVTDAQEATMHAWEEEFGKIRWCAGGDQYRYNSKLRDIGFDVMDSERAAGTAEQRRRWVGARLGTSLSEGQSVGTSPRPRMMYLADHCKAWSEEMPKYARKPQRSDEDDSRRDVVKLNDDAIDASLYGCEEVELRGARRPQSFRTEL